MTDLTLRNLTDAQRADALAQLTAAIPVVTPPEPPVVVPPPTGQAWKTPTPRANHYENEVAPPYKEDTLYTNCTNVTLPWYAKHVTVVGGNKGPETIKSWLDVWFGGTPEKLLQPPPHTNGDTIQLQRGYGDLAHPVPDHVTLAYIHIKGVYYKLPTASHPDGVQHKAGTYITYGGMVFEDVDYGCQALFIAEPGLNASGGPIGDVLVDECQFKSIRHPFAINIGSTFEDAGPITFRNNDLGGSLAHVGASAAKVVWETSNVNGHLEIS